MINVLYYFSFAIVCTALALGICALSWTHRCNYVFGWVLP